MDGLQRVRKQGTVQPWRPHRQTVTCLKLLNTRPSETPEHDAGVGAAEAEVVAHHCVQGNVLPGFQ